MPGPVYIPRSARQALSRDATWTLPAAPKSESDEGSYGGFDGTAPDMRGDTAKPLDPDGPAPAGL